MQTQQRYWFPAKRYGWGWGLPATWEGWLVLAGYLGLIAVGVFLFPSRVGLAAFTIYAVLLSVAFTFVCWWKGEPTRWLGND